LDHWIVVVCYWSISCEESRPHASKHIIRKKKRCRCKTEGTIFHKKILHAVFNKLDILNFKLWDKVFISLVATFYEGYIRDFHFEKRMCIESDSCVFALVLVSDLEQKVQRSKRDRRNSLHRTQLLESQMKTVRGELVGTLDHLEELRTKLRRSQQKSEEREAAMQKLAAGLR